MPVVINGKSYLQTHEAAAAIGVSKQTLQRWFREHRILEVGRDHRGWRVFNEADMQRLQQYMSVSSPTES